MSQPQPFICSVCNEMITGQYGNNAWPLNDGRCCDDCNALVIVARLRDLRREKK